MIHAFYKETGRLLRSARNDALILVFASLFVLTGVNNLFAFTVTYPDTPIVVTELPPTITSQDLLVPHNLIRDSYSFLYVVYSTTDAIKISRSTDNGLTWSLFATPAVKKDWRDQFGIPRIAIDSGDSIYVSWKGDYYPSGQNTYSNKFNGRNWTGPVNVSRDTLVVGSTYFSALTVDRRNTPHVVWTGPEEGPFNDTLWYTHMDSSGQWVWPPVEVGEHPVSDYPVLIADERNNVHLGYDWYISLDQCYARYRKRFNNGQWGEIESVFVVLDTLSSTTPALTIIPGDTTPHATLGAGCVRVSHGPWTSIYYRYRTNTGWSTPFKLMPDHYNWFHSSPQITADSQGHLYSAWMLEQYTPSGLMVGRNIWMNQSVTPPFWQGAFKVTSDTIIQGVYPYRLNDYPGLGYPVTENGVDITWMRTTYDTVNGQHYYLMYHRLPSLLGVEQEKEKVPPREPELTLSPRPNPARGEMELVYGIPKQEIVSLTVYNFLGERVRTLVHGPTPAGVYRAKWNGKDERLREAPSGTYFFQLTVGEKQVIKKGTFIR